MYLELDIKSLQPEVWHLPSPKIPRLARVECNDFGTRQEMTSATIVFEETIEYQ